MTTTREDGRRLDELRPLAFVRDFTTMAMGSVLVSFGETKVLCTASVDEDVPRWMRGKGEGWVTAEYSMLPGSSPERVRRVTVADKMRMLSGNATGASWCEPNIMPRSRAQPVGEMFWPFTGPTV